MVFDVICCNIIMWSFMRLKKSTTKTRDIGECFIALQVSHNIPSICIIICEKWETILYFFLKKLINNS